VIPAGPLSLDALIEETRRMVRAEIAAIEAAVAKLRGPGVAGEAPAGAGEQAAVGVESPRGAP